MFDGVSIGKGHLTGTGFPKVFYLRYDSYRNNWPLLALATVREKSAMA